MWLLFGCFCFDDIYLVAGVTSYILWSMYNRWDNPSSLYLIMHDEDCALLSMDPMFHCHSHMTRCCTQALRVPLLPADDHLSLRLPGVNSQYDAQNSQSSRAKIARSSRAKWTANTLELNVAWHHDFRVRRAPNNGAYVTHTSTNIFEVSKDS